MDWCLVDGFFFNWLKIKLYYFSLPKWKLLIEILGCALTVFGPWLALFPDQLPQTVERNIDEKNEKKSLNVTKWIQEFKVVSFRLLKKPIFTFNLMSSTFFMLGVMGYFTFIPKYFEFQFRQVMIESVYTLLNSYLPARLLIWKTFESKASPQILVLFRLSFKTRDGSKSKFFDLGRFGYGHIFVFWIESGQPSLVWVWVWKFSPKNPKISIFALRVKKNLIVKKYLDKVRSASYLLRVKIKIRLGWVRAHLQSKP